MENSLVLDIGKVILDFEEKVIMGEDQTPFTIRKFFLQKLGCTPQNNGEDAINAYDIGIMMARNANGLMPVRKSDLNFLRKVLEKSITSISPIIYATIEKELVKAESAWLDKTSDKN